MADYSVYDSDYSRMMRGERIDGCTCEVTRDANLYGWSGPEPAEWECDPECPLHGYSEAEVTE